MAERTGPAALAVAGAALAAYPALRPFGDAGTPLEAAAAFASPAWVVAHLLGVVGFALLPLGLLGLRDRLAGGPAERAGARAAVLAALGAGAALPYYGAETFALRAVGREALTRPDAGLLGLVDAVRYGPGAVLFAVGLLLVAAAGVAAAVAVWRSPALHRWSATPLALGLLLYIPQFWADCEDRRTSPVVVGWGWQQRV